MVYTWGHMSYFPSFFGGACLEKNEKNDSLGYQNSPSFSGYTPLHGIHMGPHVLFSKLFRGCTPAWYTHGATGHTVHSQLYAANCTRPTAHSQRYTTQPTVHSQPYTARHTDFTPALCFHCASSLLVLTGGVCFGILLLHVASACCFSIFSPTASFSISSNRVEHDVQLVDPPFVQVHAFAVDVLLVHGHSAPGDHVEPPRQRRALVSTERHTPG